MPVEARGLFSGILQQGYAVRCYFRNLMISATTRTPKLILLLSQVGYLVASVVNLEAVPRHGWPILFFVGAGISTFAALVRLALPESTYFAERAQAAALQEDGQKISSGRKSKIFLVQAGKALKLHWVRCIYAVLLMAGFNFLSRECRSPHPESICDMG